MEDGESPEEVLRRITKMSTGIENREIITDLNTLQRAKEEQTETLVVMS